MERKEITQYFIGRAGEALKKIPDEQFVLLQEIRLRAERPLAVTCNFGNRFVCSDGTFTYSADKALTVTADELKGVFDAVCQYSVHSFRREICEGFVTVRGGHRAGFCGTTVTREGCIENVKNISSLNFRVSHEIIGCAEELYNRTFSGGLVNLLIAGAPMSGKTTLLRDLTRLLGKRCKTAVIDERGEIASIYNGVPQNDVGFSTDVFDGYSKPDGISIAVRVMSPQVIVCDEIGSDKDYDAIKTASQSGVRIVSTIHSDSEDNLLKKLDTDIFDFIAILSERGNVSRVMKRTVNGYV